VRDDAWSPSRLIPILSGIQELLPWIRQWNNDPDPVTGIRMGDFIATFLEDQISNLNLTSDDLRNWAPPVASRRRPASRIRTRRGGSVSTELEVLAE
jgi:hypothetical protein